eukprot:CAMPEP_0204050966 /NCGR_PEP_ID=MMETSP0360-20130528/121498_1 /ASSEMBLY_ACC=CAM_ASM_000342 /TAXON_ID=268821 /ORGANISM="Scrippsiella Hangoei, Strain SHTV-5" /LENGTH=63 /DNA_ID=CAMNT_0050997971 /DNA_START=138 /DNA_END=325 /DNA_ORIENTATION=+
MASTSTSCRGLDISPDMLEAPPPLALATSASALGENSTSSSESSARLKHWAAAGGSVGGSVGA